MWGTLRAMIRNAIRRVIPAAAAAAVLAAGCGGQPAGGVAPATVTTTPAPVPKLSADQRSYLDALEAIDPYLVKRIDRTLSRAKGVCRRADEPDMTDAKLIKYTRYMLSGGDYEMTTKEARRVIKLGERYICPNL